MPTQIRSYQAITCKYQRTHAGARLTYTRMRTYKVVQRYGEITKEKNVFMEKRRKKGVHGQEGKGTPQISLFKFR